MTIYVDDYRVQSRVGSINARWSHMFAVPPDDPELHVIAQKIGLKREWFQNQHYDVTESKRMSAVAAGAVSVGAMDGARLRLEYKKTLKNDKT